MVPNAIITFDVTTNPPSSFKGLIDQTQFRLAPWKHSGKETLHREFHNKLPSYWQNTLGGKAHHMLTTAAGDSGVAGVIENKLIHFVPRW